MLENKDMVKECLRNVIDLKKLFKYDEYVIISLLNELGKIEDVDVVFEKAVENDYVEVVELLLKDERVNPAAEDDYAIGVAAKNGHEKVVELLLKDKRVDPAAKNKPIIMQ